MAAEEVTEKERDSATRKMPGSRKFSLKWFPRYERLPLHETRGWSIRECRWHQLDASVVLRRLPRNCRRSSWLRFILHCARISFSTLLNKTESKVSFWRTIAAGMTLLPGWVSFVFPLPHEWAIWLSNPEGDDFGAKNWPAIASGGYLKGAYNVSPSATSSSIKTAPQRNTLAWRNNNGPSFVAQTAAARQKASMSFLRFCGRRAVRRRAPRNFEVLVNGEVRALTADPSL